MIKTVIVTICVCLLMVGSFIGGLTVGYSFTAAPVFAALGNAFDTSRYQEGEMLVLIKDYHGIIFRKFSSSDELIKFSDGLK
jgi:hypothetical protein